MNFFYVVPWCLWLMCITSANNPFESLFKQGGSCVNVIEDQQCNSTLVESFKSHKAPSGGNKPDTFVFLFTPKSPDKAEPLHHCGGNLPPASTYDSKCNTEIIIHGHIDGVCRTAWMREIKEQIFQRKRGCYNVILVDWGWGNFLDYHDGVVNCQVVGEQVGFVVNNIMRQSGTGPEKFHVIGHSLGAISAGFVGRSVKGLRRITGLDPALPGFKYAPPNQRLTYRDAKIVDIIHTNGGDCLTFGDRRFLGHADFYVNGGTIQTSCYPYILISFLKGDIFYALSTALILPDCPHSQSHEYYKVSINPGKCQFIGETRRKFRNKTSGLRSTQWAIMGMDYEDYLPENPKSRRKYYLNTTDTCPYYDYKYLENKKLPFKNSCSEE